jgi:hypothetical protein
MPGGLPCGYDPQLGRFAQADSIIPLQTQGTQAWDRYAYVNNNPLRYTDPSGHDVGCGGREASDCGNRDWQRDKIAAMHEYLKLQVINGSLNDLDALARLTIYAASFSPSDANNFVEDIGVVLTGHTNENAVVNELLIQANKMLGSQFNVKYDRRYESIKKNGELMQSGYAEIFQDPGEYGGNQAHHYWYYVQIGYENGFFAGLIGNAAHETILGNRNGMSYQDFALGVNGIVLGKSLNKGWIRPSEVGNHILRSLSPGSYSSSAWESPFYPKNYPVHQR